MPDMTENEKREYIKTAKDNLFVEAGAGAGKTTMLSDRIVNQIASGEAMRSFVVITFTKAAAQELLERIVMTMRRRLNEAEGEERKILDDAMQRIDELHVSTIHSFCRTILMEYAFDAGFVLDPEMMDEEQEEERMKNFFDKWKSEHWKVIRDLQDAVETEWYRPLFNAFKTASSLRCPVHLDDVDPCEWTAAERFMHTAVQIASDYHAYIDADPMTMTNDQLLYKAGKLVKENDVICDKLRKKYTHLYVDEFQDTDDIQCDMIWKLAEKEPGILRDNCLFVVGDPKQSIYRFRGAQVELFYEIRERMERSSNASVISLENNFRSDASIIRWVNRTFEKRIRDYSPMQTGRHGESPYTGVFRCTMEHDESYKKSRTKKDVDIVCNLVETMTALNEKTRYGDFLIITKDKNRIAEYVRGFADKGIATAVRGKIDVESSVILNAYVSAFHVLADRSARYDQAANAQILSNMQYSDLTLEEKKAYKEELRNFAEKSGFYFRSAGGAARILYEHPEVYLPRGRDISKTELRSAKAKLLQCIDTCIAGTQGGIRELADAMLEYVKTEIPREIPLQNNEDAVAIMNVHQCKGLAGKIVIIADRAQILKDDGYDNLRIDGECLPVFKAPKDAFHSEPMITYERHPELMELNVRKREEEWVRLEYVAATRARECMIFMEELKEGAWFSNEDYDLGSLPDIMDVINSLSRHAALTASSSDGDLEDDDLQKELSLEHHLDEQCSIAVTPSSLEKSGNSGFGIHDQGYISEGRPAEDLFGTVMHRCFELVVKRRNEWLGKDVSKTVSSAVNQALMEFSEEIPDEIEEWRNFLLERISAYCIHVLPGILENAEAVYTEYPFAMSIEENEEHPEFLNGEKYKGRIDLNGTMDLVIVYHDGSAKIYDYKSDARNGMDPETFRRRMALKYQNQIALYAYALSRTGEFTGVETELIDLYRC